MNANFDDKETKVRSLLAKFSPEQLGIAKTLATLKIENKMMREQLSKAKHDYETLYQVMLVVLDACDERELRIHESHFLRFKNEYRIDQKFDEETKEVVLKLLTLRD